MSAVLAEQPVDLRAQEADVEKRRAKLAEADRADQGVVERATAIDVAHQNKITEQLAADVAQIGINERIIAGEKGLEKMLATAEDAYRRATNDVAGGTRAAKAAQQAKDAALVRIADRKRQFDALDAEERQIKLARLREGGVPVRNRLLLDVYERVTVPGIIECLASVRAHAIVAGELGFAASDLVVHEPAPQSRDRKIYLPSVFGPGDRGDTNRAEYDIDLRVTERAGEIADALRVSLGLAK